MKTVKNPQSRELDAIFRPRSVAVIGASRRRQTIGREILRNLVEFGFTGPVYPVNPTAAVVNSMKAWARLDQIPDPVDLAIIVVPRDQVLPVIDQCGKKGVRGVVVITAGFKETGVGGVRLESELARRVARYGMRMVGPNCMGVINTHPDFRLNATFASAQPARGNLGMVSQSGALGEAILADAGQVGLGVAMFASIGNKADVSGNDMLEYWECDDDVQVIMMYLESFGNPLRFTQLARRVTRQKPILTVKAGRTAAGAKAASSHTGSIVGLDIATDSLFEQCGVLRVASLEEMFVQGTALANQPIPRGDRIAIVTNAGGPAILCTDSLIGRGLELATFTASTRRALRKILPPEATVSNPVDMIASADGARYREVLERVRRDNTVDGIIAIFVSPIMIDAYEVARAIAGSAKGDKPVLSVFMGKQRTAEGLAVLREYSVPDYRFPDQAASAMAGMCRYRTLRDRPQGNPVTFKVKLSSARRAVNDARRAGRTELTSRETERLLAAYGLPLAPSRRVRSSAAAISAAQKIGYPVVLKISSEKFSHKSDVGGVKVDLRNAEEVDAAFREMTEKLRRRDPELSVVVQKLISGGREVILGMTCDVQFGPLMMFGLGGIFVEVMRDISVGVHPLNDVLARRMIERIRGYPLLSGARGEKAVSIPLLEECLLRLSQLVGDFEHELAEMDINPLIVTSRRESSFIVDARVSLKASRG